MYVIIKPFYSSQKSLFFCEGTTRVGKELSHAHNYSTILVDIVPFTKRTLPSWFDWGSHRKSLKGTTKARGRHLGYTNPNHLQNRRLSHVYVYVASRCVVAYTSESAGVQQVGSKEFPWQKNWRSPVSRYALWLGKVGSSLIRKDALEFDSSRHKQRRKA
jgi:hypothetical protein